MGATNQQSSSRQKSFFDQDKKTRFHWQSNHRQHNAPCQPEHIARSAAVLSPIAASSEAKSKLAAFRLEQKNEEMPLSSSEALKIKTKGTVEADNDQENINPNQIESCHPSLSQKSSGHDVRECPQTPVGRLPLAELIAGSEDIHYKKLDLTPVERVVWRHSQQSAGKKRSVSRRRKRRAYSSSPTSSSPNEVPNHFPPDKTSFDLQNLQNTLKTPVADPASDLWSRYSLNGINKPSPNESDKLLLNNFLNSSSPQTPAQPVRKNVRDGLQRSYSCSVEWPTSVAKRRRLRYSSSNQETSTSVAVSNPHRDETGKSKMARVSLLVEEIQGRLARPDMGKHEESEASSSSAQSANRQHISQAPQTHQSAAGSTKNGIPQKSESSFDFNDDELDIELIKTVDRAGKINSSASKSATHQNLLDDALPRSIDHSNTKSNASIINTEAIQHLENYLPKSLNAGKSNSLSSSAPLGDTNPLSSQPSKALVVSERDEFDDEDDFFAADLEDVMAKYDRQPLENTQDKPGVSRIRSPNKRYLQSSVVNPESPKEQGTGGGGDKFEREAISDDDDEFGGGLDFERIIAQCEEASQRPQRDSFSCSPNHRKTSVIQRYSILRIAEGGYEDKKGRQQRERVLLVQHEKTKFNKAITLRGAWLESPCTPGSYVHLVGEFNQQGQCIIDDTQNLLILHPDHLISATVVADSFSCTRRAVLQDRVKATSQLSEPTVYGSMLHEIFQEAMTANRWDIKWLTASIEKTAARYLESLYELNLTIENAVDHLLRKAMDIQMWAENFVAVQPKANAVIRDRNGSRSLMSINKLLDVEEKVWSPVYGLKGMVDATVQVVVKDGNGDRTVTVPLELKTGKSQNAAHKAQTALYTLLLSDRYDIEILYGILYYAETSEVFRIPAIRHELIHMVMQRNELACYVRQRLELPPMLKSPHLCGKCYAQTPCFLYHKLAEDGDEKTSGMGEAFEDQVRHLNPTHQAFFRKWDDLITKEEKESIRFRRELWTMQSAEREKVGRCFSNVVLDHAGTYELQDAPKTNRFHYIFMKDKFASGFSFTESQIVNGEPIVISDEQGHFALASGYVTNVRKERISVVLDRRLNNSRIRETGFNAKQNQAFVGIMQVTKDGVEQTTQTAAKDVATVLYRIDKDEFSSGMATVRNNLISLMQKDIFGVQALRKLVVEAAPPIFKPQSTPYVISSSASQTSLNADQKHAVEKVMSAKDYALVLGMPGTGKTTTIAHIIRALTAQGKSVLLTSYTHTAVDNILLKIRYDNIGVFRLGALAKIHPEVQEFADLAAMPMKTVEEIQKAYSRQVVATTCLGINHPIFNQKIFDYCIVDEASQITLPVCLGPIRMARTFILVGDHYQLPPLVQNREALEGGLDVSLFKLLSDTHAFSVVNLEHQYRMCEDIMTLSNTLIYNGRLKCGNSSVARRTLTIPKMDALSKHHISLKNLHSVGRKNSCLSPKRSSCWIRDLLDPSVKACLVNTDPLLAASRETKVGSRIVNHCEVTICTQLVDSLVTVGVPPSDIGVITLYRSQLALLKQNLRHRDHAIEMYTADKFQGRDKEVIVLSLVRSNDAHSVGDLLKDWRRVNVAFTRARTKLLIIGSRSTIIGNGLLEKFVRLMDSQDWVYDLPQHAMEGHIWDEASATTTIQSPQKSGKTCSNNHVATDKMKRREVTHDKENANAKGGRKKPMKLGRIDAWAMLSRKPVLRDILNDAS